MAVAIAMQAILGTLPLTQISKQSLDIQNGYDRDVQVTHPLNGFALGNAPDAQRNSIAYRALYASAGSTAWTSHPTPPTIDEHATWKPRALRVSADQARRRQTT